MSAPICFLALLALAMTGCNETRPAAVEAVPGRNSAGFDRTIVSDTVLHPGYATSVAVSIPEENLFGRFFCDRAEFFIIDQPENLFHGTRAESITLYYLDGALRQTRYTLQNDISDQLITSLGSFSITGLDSASKAIIASRQTLVPGVGGRRLHSGLGSYELRWEVGENQVRYRVSRNGTDSVFSYIERSANYERAFAEIEQHCI